MCLKHLLKDFEHYFSSMWNEHNYVVLRTFFVIALLWNWKFLQSCGHCWVFQLCWHIECSTLTASSLRIWKSSAGIPSPLLVLFIEMLPKAHLTSHSRIFDSRWLTTPSWLSGSPRSFLYSFSVNSWYLLLISSASVCFLTISVLYLPFLGWNIPLISPVFLRIFLVFPILFIFPPLISLHCSLRKAFLSLLAILWNSAFSWVYLSLSSMPFFPQLFVKPPEKTIVPSGTSFLWDDFGHCLL